MSDTAFRVNHEFTSRGAAAEMTGISEWSAVIAVGIAVAPLLAWSWSNANIGSFPETAPSLTPAASLCLALAGYSLWGQRASHNRVLCASARCCAALVVVVGLTTWMGHFVDVGGPASLFQGLTLGSYAGASGSMGSPTAICLTLLGVTLLTLDVRLGSWFPAQWLGLAVSLVALLGALGYLYDAPPLKAASGSWAMSPLAALGLLALACGALLARPRHGLLRPLFENVDSGSVALRMVPAVLLLPIALGWLRLLGQRHGLYGTETGLALYALSNVVCVGSLTWWAAARLASSEREKLGAQLEQARRTRELAVIEQRAREAMARKAAVVDGALDCIVGMDHEGRVIEFNAAAEKTFGRLREQVLGRSVADLLIPPRHREAHQRGLQRLLVTGEVRILGKRVELAGMRSDGSEFPLELTVIRIPGDEAPVFEAFIRDLTEQKAAETALRASEESKNAAQAQLVVSDRMASVGMLAAGVAHEINNPLAAVVANLDFATEKSEQLVEACKDSTTFRELTETLKDAAEAAERVRQIVKDLRIFARSAEERTEPVDVHGTLDSTLRMAKAEIRHRARITRDYGSQIPNILGNASRLGQVFLNLVVNAAQAIPEGRADANEIRISTSTDSAGRVVVEIRDTGQGMSPEVLARLFTPFFTTKPPGVGTGLGLAICKRIVTNLGGDIDVESEPGVGTTFRVVLPAAGQALASHEEAPMATRAERRGAVLVVDDDPMIGLAVRRTLSSDHEVRVTTSAGEALASLSAGSHYDVILCDMMMPVVTGMDFYRQLQQKAPEQAERVVFLTGGAFTVAAREFLDGVSNAHLEKPFQMQSLRSFINARIR